MIVTSIFYQENRLEKAFISTNQAMACGYVVSINSKWKFNVSSTVITASLLAKSIVLSDFESCHPFNTELLLIPTFIIANKGYF